MGLKKFLVSILIFMSLLIIGVTTLLSQSLSPLKQAKAETIEVASKKADLVKAENFYWYNGSDTYFTITGEDSAGEAILVIVKQEGGHIEVLKQEETLSKQEIIAKLSELEAPERILEARIGIHEGMPVWEISYRHDGGRIGYTMFSLTTGEWIRTIKNIE